MIEGNNNSPVIFSSLEDDKFEVMDLCEYYNKILGISVCSNFSDEKEMIDKSLYRTSL